MSSAIIVTARFDGCWPHAADHLHRRWAACGPVGFHRLADADARPLAAIVADPSALTRLTLLGRQAGVADLAPFSSLRELATDGALPTAVQTALQARGVACYAPRNEGFWSRSLAEFGLALTISGLRRIPQLHAAMRSGHDVWDYRPADGIGIAGGRGAQFGDDPRWSHGTVHGKRLRIAGLGNIGALYAHYCRTLGADVAAWDPHIPDAAFAVAGVRRRFRLAELVADAEIFAPILPLRDGTAGLIDAALVRALPRGCLVLLITRSGIVDMPELRRRVLAGELALAADVFDQEPVPLDDPLLGHPAVVHTPHAAGRTADANRAFADHLAEQFAASGPSAAGPSSP